MNFRRGHGREEPEINFIPLIDVLLVILIFLMVTTTYARFSEIKINLPSGTAQVAEEKSADIPVAVAADGRMLVGEQKLAASDQAALVAALKQAAAGKKQPMVIINADASATHQSVVTVMEAARVANLNQLTFATRNPDKQ
jgi:biopolymer transport protein ExbD